LKGPTVRDGLHWWLADDAPEDALERAQRAAAALAVGELVDRKSGRRKSLYGLRLDAPDASAAAGEPDHLLKVNSYEGLGRLRRRVRGSKARRELSRAEAVAALGLPTPIPLAAGEEIRGGLRRCLLLTRILPGVVDLRRLWDGPEIPRARRWALARAFGELTRAMHDAGVDQEDFAPNNFLVGPGDVPRLWIIDFERAAIGRTVPRRRRLRALGKIDREFLRASRTDRLRFLQGYAGDREAVRSWAARIGEEARARTLRDLERMRRTAVQRGRRMAPDRREGWEGWARSDAPAPLVAAALAPGPAGPSPRAWTVPGGWVVGWAALPRGDAAERWARANLLCARRELAPQPLGCWVRGTEARLVYAAPAGGHLPAASGLEGHEQAAWSSLRAVSARLGRVGDRQHPPLLGFAPGRFGRLEALWLEPGQLELGPGSASSE
jgi:tRNA A-37 threonylcarbamoyl transferase component Bud32